MLAARNNFLTASGGPSYELGLSSALLTFSGQNSSWSQETIDISLYKGATARLVFYYQSLPVSNGYQGDLQLDDINIDGTLWTFETSFSWQTTNTNILLSNFSNAQSAYNAAASAFISVPSGTSAGLWNRDLGGTPSSSTALAYDHTLGNSAGYYLYAETSVTHPYGFWLRSPTFTLSNSPTLDFWNARYGATIGSCSVYLDVIS